MATIKIERVLEGRMGTNLSYAFEVYVDGELVGFSKRRWVAQAIGEAIVAGRIEATGYTTMRLENWAREHDRAMFERMLKSGDA